ncbi:hypothetical protein K450DRAFT_218684 [Umbelopsis ramanniana AG]|uniref:Uncharacterized protein n=1 Tax=Umbelopsis ramanniana AG TaxID=1314678 RepID=A0AAD5EIU0_UMBRA|nr:uncharacterized protein K450DRAFT_218684 [Umbelopsis ramanniana AG]KAI8584212.1 hypothetical protein K450DRAFT_218684 [Umbelopsis ramanniana AG]
MDQNLSGFKYLWLRLVYTHFFFFYGSFFILFSRYLYSASLNMSNSCFLYIRCLLLSCYFQKKGLFCQIPTIKKYLLYLNFFFDIFCY